VKRILVTGGSGYLGACIIATALTAPSEWRVTGTYFSRPPRLAPAPMQQVDLREPEAVRQLLALVAPEAVIHTACSNRDAASVEAVVPAARNLAAACAAAGIRLVHVSTDLVFDGENAPYPDAAVPTPITPYGRAKAEAEALIAELYPPAVITRPPLIWALDPMDRQTGWLVDGLRQGKPVTLFTDEIRCPVYLHDLSAGLLELAALPHEAGTLNMGGRQPLIRWDLGMRLLRAMGLQPADNVKPGTVAGSGQVRARNLTLESRRAEQTLATRLRGVDEVLTGY
jgi:dTDP-4-dehydrorhamnose reductase